MKNIITLTTIPSRVPYLPFFLKNIKNQIKKPDRVELYLPYEYSRRDLGKVNLEEIPSDFDVIRCEDYGPATKIIPAIQKHKKNNNRLIFCDDDRYYSDDWLSRLINLSEKNPNSCIADEVTSIDALLYLHKKGFIRKNLYYRVKRILSLGIWKPKNFNNIKPNLIHGFGGVLVKSKFFSNDINKLPDIVWPVDDIWISAHLEKNKIELIYSNRDKSKKSKPIFLPGDKNYQNDELVNLEINGIKKLELNYLIIKYCMNNLDVWHKYSSFLKK